MQYNIMIVSDHTLFRQALVAVIEKIPKLKIAALASGDCEAISKLNDRKNISALLLLIQGTDGFQLIEKVKVSNPLVKIIVVSMHDNDLLINYALKHGAHGYISQKSGTEEILQAVEDVIEKGFHFNETTTVALLHNLTQPKSHKPALRINGRKFSERELLIIELLSKEFSNRDIATKMYLSQRTVEGIRKHMMNKLGVKTAIGLVTFAIKNELVKL